VSNYIANLLSLYASIMPGYITDEFSPVSTITCLMLDTYNPIPNHALDCTLFYYKVIIIEHSSTVKIVVSLIHFYESLSYSFVCVSFLSFLLLGFKIHGMLMSVLSVTYLISYLCCIPE
jgi:hypothetical protein